jgi:hypothetical protein
VTTDLIPPGTYRGRAVNWGLSTTSTGKEQVAVEFEFPDAAGVVQRLTWFGFFTEKTWERTIQSLRHCGWKGVDLDDLGGLDASEVDLVVEHDTYNGVTRAKINWVNEAGALPFVQPMEATAARSFAARMRGKVASVKPKSTPRAPARTEPPPHTDSDAPPF